MSAMIPELGSFALILALIASLLQAGLGLYGAARNDRELMTAARLAAGIGFALIVIAFAALMAAHVGDDFSVLNVVLNSHTKKPLLYKITGSWASHEGSMLLWMLILTVFGAALAIAPKAMPLALRARALGVQGLLGIGFASFIVFTSNPFARVWPAPLEGNDLNPLLQDPGLAFHPPFLYVGYVGFSLVFALAAALLLGEAPEKHIKFLRPWALAAWASLTFGMAMGSWWAYYELGWGGFWFWDPVENAALMPWLAGTAFIHSLAASSKRGAFLRWTFLLAILAFSLSLLGTFLVRSGVLTSVHAFAVDPLRGVFVLVLLALAVGGALTLYALRAPGLPESPIFAPLSRESFLLINNLFLATACATLATGTLYPLLLTAVGGGTVSVGAPYFNATVLPLMMPVAALMIVGPLLNWEKNRVVAQEPLKIALIAVVAAQGIGLYLYGFKSFLGLLALMLGTWVIAGTLADAYRLGDARRAQRPRLLAHIGFGVAVIGMSGAAFSDVHTFSMRPHDTTEIAGYRIELESVAPVEGPNFSALRGLFRITHEGQAITMQPERRYYPSQGTLITDVAIHTNLIGDLYLVLGAPEDENEDADQARYTVRLHINPLVPWIWLGAAIMALGGVAGVLQKKR